SVALSNRCALVGAPGAGAVYLYTISGRLLHAFKDVSAGPNFGEAVALSGSTLAIGADEFQDESGVVFLYSTNGELLRSFCNPYHGFADFGVSLPLSATEILVGAMSVDGYVGAAYLYSTSGQLLHSFQDP